MIDLDHDDIDLVWRAGLAQFDDRSPDDPAARVASRIARRHRTRVTRTVISAALAIALAVGAIGLVRRNQSVNVAATGPIAKVTVVDGALGYLRISLFGPDVVDPTHARLPAGRVRFTVFMTGSHYLVIDGVPGFSVGGGNQPAGHARRTVVTVQLKPGRYLMHCTIPGHSQAGENAVLIVR